jgi:N-acetylneuraminic acid mutarotase
MRLALALCAVLTLVALGTAGRSPHERSGGSWRELPPSPLLARADYAAVWTGREMLVWGGNSGERSYADGAAYDPDRNRWRRLAPAPLAPRSRATAVWTGREMLLWGGDAGGGVHRFGDGAAYDPVRDRWRKLATSPLTGRFGHTAVWTGRLMIVFGGFTTCGFTLCESGEAAAYDPMRDRWRYLNFWHGRWDHTAVWTGRELLVWGGDGPSEYEANGAAYRPATDRWRRLPRGPLEGRVGHSAIWTGAEMIVLGGASNRKLDVEGAAYDPARRRWRTLPRSPAGWPAWHEAVWAKDRMLAWGRGARGAYSPETNRWEALPAAPLAVRIEHSAVWTGRELIVWGGESCTDSCHRADGAAYKPPLASAGRIAGFGITATLPSGWHGRVTRGTLMASTATLPPERGWLSTELGRSLRPGDLGVLLFEAERGFGVPIEPSVYLRGPARPFTAREFAHTSRQRFARRNFTVGGRFFDLFVEARDRAPGPRALGRLNALVRSLEIERGDHYPGTVEAARFPPAWGWSTRTRGAVPFRPVTVSVTVSATIAYRDPHNALPPRRTLEALPPDGIAIRVTLVADNRQIPVASRDDRELARRPYRLADGSCGAFKGFPESVRACVLRALVPRQYRVEIWVLYGRASPTRPQRARAQAQLDRLVLPSWPRWP